MMGRRWVVVPLLLIMGADLLALPLTHATTTTLLLVAMAIGFVDDIGSGMMTTPGADHAPRSGRARCPVAWGCWPPPWRRGPASQLPECCLFS